MLCTLQQHQCGCLRARVKPTHVRTNRLLSTPTIARQAQEQGPICAPAEGKKGHTAVAGLAAAVLLLAGQQPCAARQQLPPLDTDPNRCERAYVGNTIGQSNAVSNKILDLRKCTYSGKDLSKKVLSGALLENTDMSNTNLIESVLTKAYAVKANFQGSDMTNAVVDRVNFKQANLTNAKFKNAIVTGSMFEGAKLDGVDFEDALIGREDVKKLCLNPSLQPEGREEVGCRN